MIQHNVFFQWKPSMTSALEQASFAQFRAMKALIPGIEEATTLRFWSRERLSAMTFDSDGSHRRDRVRS